MQAMGSSGYIAFVEESTWGVTPTTPQLKRLSNTVYGESLTGSADTLKSNAISSNRGSADVISAQIKSQGSLPFELGANDQFGTILKCLLASNPTTTGAGPTYTHVIKRGKIRKSLTIEKGFTDINQYAVFTGVVPNSMNISLDPNGSATGSLDVMAKDFNFNQTPLDATLSESVHSVYANFEAAVLEGGVSAQVVNADFTITNDLFDTRVIGSRYSANIGLGRGSIEGNISFLFEDQTYVDKWLNSTETSLKFTYTKGNDSLSFEFPRCKYVGEGMPKIETDQGILINLKFIALVDSVTNTDIIVTLVNEQATI